MVSVTSEEAKYIRENGYGKYVGQNGQKTSKRKSYTLEENEEALTLLNVYRTKITKVIYDSMKEGR